PPRLLYHGPVNPTPPLLHPAFPSPPRAQSRPRHRLGNAHRPAGGRLGGAAALTWREFTHAMLALVAIEDAILMTVRAGESYMLAALAEAEAAAARGEVPVGAVVVGGGPAPAPP